MKKIFIGILLVAILAGALWAGYFLADIFLQNSQAGTADQAFKISPGEGANLVIEKLFQAKLIDNRLNLKVYFWLTRGANRIQAGDYQLRPSLSLRDLVDIITYGKGGANEKDVTIIEGWKNSQIAEYLAGNLFSYDGETGSKDKYIKDFNQAVKQQYNYEFLSDLPKGVDLEGYLFPDTYRFYADVEPAVVVGKMLSNFDKKLTPDLRDKIKQQNKTVYQIVTLASVVESEVKTNQDRRMVADIFWRRLKAGMPLQSDVTVLYAMGKKDIELSLKDLQIDSPYNTYKYPGLPLGPICNPGIETIEAVINPTPNDYWYFLATPDGQTIFSKTFAEHNIAKAKYLK